MTTKKTFFALFLTAVFFVPFAASAQITIGSGNQPSPWSLLYLDNSEQEQPKALHLPRLYIGYDRVDLDIEALPLPDQERAKGLMIFNLFNNCLEFWNGERWISLCEDRPLPPSLPTTISISPNSHGFPAEVVWANQCVVFTITVTNHTAGAPYFGFLAIEEPAWEFSLNYDASSSIGNITICVGNNYGPQVLFQEFRIYTACGTAHVDFAIAQWCDEEIWGMCDW